jgi:hypothetical protein
LVIEAHVGRLAHLHGHALAECEVVLGQRHQAGPLGLEGLAHAQGAVLGPAPIGGLALAPQPGLRVEVVKSVNVRPAKKLSRM